MLEEGLVEAITGIVVVFVTFSSVQTLLLAALLVSSVGRK